MDDGTLRCARCGRRYREADNGDAACAYHTGSLRDYDSGPGEGVSGDFFECCMRQIQSGQHALDVPGCVTGRHVEADPDDPGPVLREKLQRRQVRDLVIDEQLPPDEIEPVQRRLGRFLAGTMADPTYAERAWMDARLMELADSTWLLAQLTDPAHDLDRRRLVAGALTDKENVERLRRVAGLVPP